MTKTLHRVLKQYGHWIFLGFMILLTVYMDVYVSRNILDGDTSDYVNRGWIMAHQHNPFTRDFFFTTEVRLLDISAVYSLFFHFTDDWTLVRILGAIAMQTWYVLSFLYVCKQAGLGKTSAVFGAGMLLVPFSTPYARIVLYHMYYILYLSNSFWLMGLTLRLTQVQKKDISKAIFPAILLSGLWFFVGLNGIRHMMMLGIPMLLFAVIQLMLALRDYQWNDGKLIGEQPFWQTIPVRFTGIVLASLAFFMAGFLVNTHVLLPYFGVSDMSISFFTTGLPSNHYAQIYDGWLTAIGIRNAGLQLVGIRGLSLICALVTFGYLLIVSAESCFRQKHFGLRFLQSILAISFVITTMVFIFDSRGGRFFELYFVPVVAMAPCALATELESLKANGVSACRKLITITVCACFLFQGVYTMYFIRVEKNEMDSWNGLAYTEMNTIDQVKDCADFMLEKGYTHGLINYWYACPIIELSNGALNVTGLENDRNGYIIRCRWGTSKTAFAPENLPEKAVVFIKRGENEWFETDFPDAPLVHEGWIFNGYEVDTSLIQLDKE